MSTITTILDFIYQVSQFFMPIFIFVLVFNAGMTEHPKTIISTMQEDWKFFLRLVLYNNLFLPIAVWFILQFLPVDPVFANALIITFMTAGASTIIVFVQMTGEEIKYAVATMILLTTLTIIIVPVLLPVLIVGANVSPMELVSGLLTSVILPLVLGIALRVISSDTADKIAPYVQKIQTITMNIAIYGMIIGLLPQLIGLIGRGVILTGTILLLLAFGGGYLLEIKNDDKAEQWTSAFAGGQVNGAVAFSIVLSNFSNQNLLLAVAVISTIGTVIFTQIAKYINNGKETENATPESD
jgi:BASS family bile acid:Na+ symporter